MHQIPKGFGEYIHNKIEKLHDQFEQNRTESSSALFKGLTFFINGYTEPSYQQLKSLIANHSGKFCHYYDGSKVTHVLSQEIPKNKFKFFSSTARLVRPQWLVDCIEQNCLLPMNSYEICPSSGSSSNSFIQDYFGASRLHHLSRWKGELQAYAAELMKDKIASEDSVLILHVDIDCFFVSASCSNGQETGLIEREPLGVAHATNSTSTTHSTSDIASCNYVARSFGVKNGMRVKTAIQLCPQLKLLPYNFELYNEISRAFYKILSQYSTRLEAVSCDEAYLSISSCLEDCFDEESVKKKLLGIKERIKKELNINVSIGASYNKLLARLCTKLAKPSGIQVHLDPLEARSFVGKFSIKDIPGIGGSSCAKLAENGICSMKELQSATIDKLKMILGNKIGETLFNKAKGIDHSQLATGSLQRTTSVGINWGVRLVDESELKQFLSGLVDELQERLAGHPISKVSLRVMIAIDCTVAPIKFLGHGNCNEHSKSSNFINGESFLDRCITLFKELQKGVKFKIEAIRGINISVEKAVSLPTSQTLMNYFCKDTEMKRNEKTRILLNNNNNNNVKSFISVKQLWRIKQKLKECQDDNDKLNFFHSTITNLYAQRQFDCIQSLLSFVKRTCSSEFYSLAFEMTKSLMDCIELKEY